MAGSSSGKSKSIEYAKEIHYIFLFLCFLVGITSLWFIMDWHADVEKKPAKLTFIRQLFGYPFILLFCPVLLYLEYIRVNYNRLVPVKIRYTLLVVTGLGVAAGFEFLGTPYYRDYLQQRGYIHCEKEDTVIQTSGRGASSAAKEVWRLHNC